MKKFIFLFFFLNPNTSKCQYLSISSNIGIALGETKLIKKNMLVGGMQFGYIKKLNQTSEITFSVGQSVINFDYYDQNLNSVYNERKFITIPIILTKNINYFKSDKFNLNIGIGLIGNWCYKDIRETKNILYTSKTKIKNTGISAGFLFDLSIKYKLNKITYISVSLQPQVDVLTKYKSEDNKINLKKNLLNFSYIIDIKKNKK